MLDNIIPTNDCICTQTETNQATVRPRARSSWAWELYVEDSGRAVCRFACDITCRMFIFFSLVVYLSTVQ